MAGLAAYVGLLKIGEIKIPFWISDNQIIHNYVETTLSIKEFNGRVLKINSGCIQVKAGPLQFSALHICPIIMCYFK
jgi:hypothetical protein